MKKVLLDTNAYSNLLKGNKVVYRTLSMAEIVYMSIFVLGELYAGFRGGKKELLNKELLNRFLAKPTVQILDATLETAEVFGQLKYDLKVAGSLIPINDVWIASQSIETGSVIITFDTHFLNIKGLRLWDHMPVS